MADQSRVPANPSPSSEPEFGPEAKTTVIWSVLLIFAGLIFGFGVLASDVAKNGRISQGASTLPLLFPSWFVALATATFLLKLVASTPKWPDHQSKEVVSATLENEADPAFENEATGSWFSSLPCLGF